MDFSLSNLETPGVIFLSRLGATRGVSILRTRSVRTPTNVSTDVLQPGARSSGNGTAIIQYIDTQTNLTGQLGAISLIQRVSGARINEILRLTTANIVDKEFLIIVASKRSRSTICRLPELRSQLMTYDPRDELPLFSVSYSQVYRSYIKAGLAVRFAGGVNKSVTHSYRINRIQSVHNSILNTSITAEVVGHKSENSTLTYLKKGINHG